MFKICFLLTIIFIDLAILMRSLLAGIGEPPPLGRRKNLLGIWEQFTLTFTSVAISTFPAPEHHIPIAPDDCQDISIAPARFSSVSVYARHCCIQLLSQFRRQSIVQVAKNVLDDAVVLRASVDQHLSRPWTDIASPILMQIELAPRILRASSC